MSLPKSPAAPRTDRRFYDLRDGRMSGVHFGPTEEPLRLVMLNANGFNGLSYRSILEPLGVHVAALDLRGHGMSELPIDSENLPNWHIFRDDIVEFFNRYVDAPVVLAGHSFGAVSGILAAPQLGEKLGGYAGFDPVSMPLAPRLFARFKWARAIMKKRIPIARSAGRRRFVFDSADAAFERYKGRGAFKNFNPQALRDYLEGGLIPHEDGVQLSCLPKWEQAVFAAQAQNLYRCVSALPKNTAIVYGGKGAVSTRGTRKKVQQKLSGGSMSYLREFSHLFPFQNTEFAVKTLRKAIDNLD